MRPAVGRRRHRTAGARTRLSPDERRRQLLQVAAELMTQRGIDAVQFAEVAAAAGVTRQLVYRFFPSRQALIMAVLEDFAGELTQRFGRGAARSIPGSLDEVTRVFVEAVCDTIEARGTCSIRKGRIRRWRGWDSASRISWSRRGMHASRKPPAPVRARLQ
ncbi:MAG: TetR/AcrR family transcriptional regulator [Deltaproteobacteria bacterium]|nr:TetR/AcrR family transcriptional regulator [Deltaproteobacteria bacterium]